MMQLEKVPFSIAEVIGQVHEMLAIQAAEKGLNFENEIDKNMLPLVIGDPTRLTQILTNLAGNAIKFTDEGSVQITAVATGNTVENIDVQFSVSDTGIGISQQDIATIFLSLIHI